MRGTRIWEKKFGLLEGVRKDQSSAGGPRNSRILYLRIRLFAVSKNIPKFRIRDSLALIPSLIRGFWMICGLKLHKRYHFLAIQGSLVIRGFKICGPLTERIYRELRGPPVLVLGKIYFNIWRHT